MTHAAATIELEPGIPEFLRPENRDKPFSTEDVMSKAEAEVIDPNGRANAVAVASPPSVLAQISDTAAIVQMIERAARDPNVDIDKMERLLQMQERVVARAAKAEYDAALAEMAPELPVIPERGEIKNSAGKVQSTYALWEDLNDAIKPVLAKHGFAISFRTGQTDSKIVVTGVLSHRGGHREETTMHLPTDTSGSKNAVQAVGSSTSYGKRYTAAALLNLTSRGEDDDGKAGGGNASATITDEQVREVSDLLTKTKSNLALFLKKLKLDSLANIRADRFDEVIKLIVDTAQKRAERAAQGGRQ